jgi:hypothetical protein
MKAFREAERWKFYYSPEGYPYYFNDLTGISEWATQDTYFMSIYDEQSQTVNEENNTSYSVEKNGKEILTKENVNSVEEEDEGDYDEEDAESEEDEENGSSSLNENLEKQFRQYLRTPEGIAAVLEERDRIVKYMEKAEKQNQQKREMQYLKSLFATKNNDDVVSPAKNSGNSVWNTTMSAAWSWLTEKPPADTASKSIKKKTQRFKKFTAEKKDKSDDVEDGNNTTVDAESGESDEDDSNDEDNDESSLSTDDSDEEVQKSQLRSQISAWMSWQSVQNSLLQPSSQYLNNVLASLGSNRENIEEGGESSSRPTMFENISKNAWDFTVAAATVTGQASYYAIVGTYVRLEPYLIQFMEQIIDINHIEGENNTLRGRIENLSPRPRESERVTINIESVFGEVVHPRLPTTPRPDDLSFNPIMAKNSIDKTIDDSIENGGSTNCSVSGLPMSSSDQIATGTNIEEVKSVEQLEHHLHSTEVTADSTNVQNDSSGWKVIITEDEAQRQQSSPIITSEDKDMEHASLEEDSSMSLPPGLPAEISSNV